MAQLTPTPTEPPAVRASGGNTSLRTAQGNGARPILNDSTKPIVPTRESACWPMLRPIASRSEKRDVPNTDTSKSRRVPTDWRVSNVRIVVRGRERRSYLGQEPRNKVEWNADRHHAKRDQA